MTHLETTTTTSTKTTSTTKVAVSDAQKIYQELVASSHNEWEAIFGRRIVKKGRVR